MSHTYQNVPLTPTPKQLHDQALAQSALDQYTATNHASTNITSTSTSIAVVPQKAKHHESRVDRDIVLFTSAALLVALVAVVAIEYLWRRSLKKPVSPAAKNTVSSENTPVPAPAPVGEPKPAGFHVPPPAAR